MPTKQPLSNWKTLNDFLRSTKDEAAVWALLEAEKTGEKRFIFLNRIMARGNKLRRMRERKELAEMSA